jgi:hypothetical protein
LEEKGTLCSFIVDKRHGSKRKASKESKCRLKCTSAIGCFDDGDQGWCVRWGFCLRRCPGEMQLTVKPASTQPIRGARPSETSGQPPRDPQRLRKGEAG